MEWKVQDIISYIPYASTGENAGNPLELGMQELRIEFFYVKIVIIVTKLVKLEKYLNSFFKSNIDLNMSCMYNLAYIIQDI